VQEIRATTPLYNNKKKYGIHDEALQIILNLANHNSVHIFANIVIAH